MSNIQTNPTYLRDRALAFITRGEELFEKSKTMRDKEKGYKIFKKGLEYMIEYGKIETQAELAKKVKKLLSEWIPKAKEMEIEIYQPIAVSSNAFKDKLIMDNNGSIVNKSNFPDGIADSKENLVPNSSERVSKAKNAKKGDKFEVRGQTSPKQKRKIESNDDYRHKLIANLEGVIVTEKPNVKWEDVAGLEQAKKSLQEAVIYPITFPHLFVGIRTPWKGILLYGPPGTGKTFLAKACASEANATFFSISSSDILSKYVGESEKLIKTLFNMARQKKPAIIFIDEIDSILSSRSAEENEATRRVKTEFLVQMQGLGKDDQGILVLGATNIPWALDPAVRRRFEKRIYIPLPDSTARRVLLINQLNKTPTLLEPKDIDYLAQRTEGFSGSDMNILVRDACFEPLRGAQDATHFKIVDYLPDKKPIYQPCHPSDPSARPMKLFDIPGPQVKLRAISLTDFETAFQKTKPSVSHSDIKKHEEFTQKYGIEG